MIEIKRRISLPSTWTHLKAAANAGPSATLIQSGDLIPFTLKNGEKLAVRATRDDTGKLFFVLEDCMKDNHAMNNERTNMGGWNACDMRKYLNTEVFALLPVELQTVIVPTTIVQIVDGKRVESKDKLFLLSMTQVFGKGEYSELEPEDAKFDYFCHRKDRLKEYTEYKPFWGWWLRSPVTSSVASSSSFFYTVNSYGGHSYSNYANISYGVAFAFCIN